MTPADFQSLLVINLIAGPSSGKSTIAADVFSTLKRKGIVCELVQEEAKDYIYAENFHTLNNQPLITINQFNRLYRLVGKVDVAVTDTSLLLGSVYSKPWVPATFYPFMRDLYGLFDNLNFWVDRPPAHTFQQSGRVHNYAQSVESDTVVRALAREWAIELQEVQCGDADAIVHAVLNRLAVKYATCSALPPRSTPSPAPSTSP